ncbi:hypothetical protein I7I50_07232 [Histoplasma capsulatum G186AR]|uniref:Uncharacterized protein n=1 Tax=Ajellomyces capsulatus TaxID=5037 RepID=A0A8H7YVM9_AJECA|nr:hypothetical protein I7I52_09696 [Histoplasma capsulatum]QSS67984.1 hypothetical protein I7I50_07232 [Histoplasma capsulatum G186AR]
MPAGGMALVRESDIRNLNTCKIIRNHQLHSLRGSKKKKRCLQSRQRSPFKLSTCICVPETTREQRAFFSRSGRRAELRTAMNPVPQVYRCSARLQGKLCGLHLQGIGSACRQSTSARC